jgi:hypothetical protein
LRSEKVDPKFSKKCSFPNGQRHISCPKTQHSKKTRFNSNSIFSMFRTKIIDVWNILLNVPVFPIEEFEKFAYSFVHRSWNAIFFLFAHFCCTKTMCIHFASFFYYVSSLIIFHNSKSKEFKFAIFLKNITQVLFAKFFLNLNNKTTKKNSEMHFCFESFALHNIKKIFNNKYDTCFREPEQTIE